MRPETRAHERTRRRYFLSFYESVQGPHPGVDHTLIKPDSVADITKGMPLTDYQKERITGVIASLEHPRVGAIAKVCREVGVRDPETVHELHRRHQALTKSFIIKGNATYHPENETWIQQWRSEGRHIDVVSEDERDYTDPDERYAHYPTDAGTNRLNRFFNENPLPPGNQMGDWKGSRIQKADAAKVQETGHQAPPKEHREEGATQRSQYADPENYKYPLHSKKNVRAAISYFSQSKNSSMYSPEKRRKMWGRILRAAKRFGINVSEAVQERKKAGEAMDQLSMNSAAQTARTLDLLDKAVDGRPLSHALRAQLRHVLTRARAWGFAPERTHPQLVKAAGLTLTEERPTYGYPEDVHPDYSEFRDVFIKANSDRPMGYQLGKKLLKPYLEVKIARRVKVAIDRDIAEQQDYARKAGYVGDHPPFLRPDAGQIAESVWTDLVRETGYESADPNLVAALNMSSVTKGWVTGVARRCCEELLAKVEPGLRHQHHDMSPY